MNTYDTTVTAVHLGERAEGEWRHHAWDVTLNRGDQTMSVPYKMGLGHEQTRCGKRKPSASRYRADTLQVCDHVTCQRVGWKPIPPTLYDVLTSLKADDVQGETFADWCGNFGYDTDSRKAMDLYLACQESTDKSRRFFGVDWQRIVEDEDYT